MFRYLSLLMLCGLNVQAQDTTALRWGYDTNYVRRYNDRLAISVFQSQKSFEFDFSQKLVPDDNAISALTYIARSNKVSGISVAYDKISFSIGAKTPVSESEIAKKGTTSYNDYSIAFTSNKYRLEAAYKNYEGFYESHTGRYDSTFNDTTPYFKRPDMRSFLLQVKFFYFFNHKRFSYSASYANTYRQMKSSGSFFAYSDLFYNKIRDPMRFIPPQLDSMYGNYSNLNTIRATGLTLGGGYSFNLIILRTVYFNGTLGLAGQFYQQQTVSSDGRINSTVLKAGFTGSDLRAALGWNDRNFFASLTFITELSVYNFSKVSVTSRLFSALFSVGYRFPFKEGKWIKKLKENRYYKML
jgi:hypothetical protein